MRLVEEVDMLLERMSPSEARKVLGLSGAASKEQVQRSWKKLAFKHHPDRGGDAEEMKKVNQARDTLLSPSAKPGRAQPSQQARRTTRERETGPPAPEPPRPPGEPSIKGVWAKAPHNVEWLFQSEYLHGDSGWKTDPVMHRNETRGTIIYGRTPTQHVFMAITMTTNTTSGDLGRDSKKAKAYATLVMPSALRVNLAKVGLKSIKALAEHMGVKSYRRLKFVRWDEKAKTSEGDLFNPRGTSFSFKGIVALINQAEDGADRKHTIEVSGESIKGEQRKARVARHGGRSGRMFKAYWNNWTFFVDGKKVRDLTEDEVEKLQKHNWFFSIYHNKSYYGQRVNLTRKRGGTSRYSMSSGAKEVLSELIKHLDSGKLKSKVAATIRSL